MSLRKRITSSPTRCLWFLNTKIKPNQAKYTQNKAIFFIQTRQFFIFSIFHIQIPSMFSLKNIPSTTSVLSTYTTFTASAMLVRSVINEVKTVTRQLIPQQLQEMIISKLGGHFCGNLSSKMTLIIDESNGYTVNHIYEAAEIYLQTKINTSIERLKVSKGQRDKKLSLTINKGEKIIDVFEGIQLRWEMTCQETKESSQSGKPAKKAMELSFHKKYMDKVLSSYLPYVMERSNTIKEENKVVKLYALGNFYADREGAWGSTNLDHPSTFDTLAMDPTLKKELIDDLDRFVRRRDYYRRVGKAWKRGYLLYGPPGTGKSSLVAAMANYLKFNIFDLELASLHSNSELRRLLVSTTNRSILVIEDIDCSVEMQNRHSGGSNNNSRSQLTLSGLLNFIDGLWSSCGDERIIVFTTNHKDRLDPALLRPGRMDLHIHMSYCTPSGFKILASNYLGITNHNLFVQIDQMLTEVEVTPAEIAEELMKNEDADIALRGLINFLRRKKTEHGVCSDEGNEQDKQDISEGWTKVGNKRRATMEIAGIEKARRARNVIPRPPISHGTNI